MEAAIHNKNEQTNSKKVCGQWDFAEGYPKGARQALSVFYELLIEKKNCNAIKENLYP